MVSLEFFIDIILLAHYGPGVDSASNRNENREYFLGVKSGRCLGPTTLPPSCADCLEIWEPQPPGTLWSCGIALPFTGVKIISYIWCPYMLILCSELCVALQYFVQITVFETMYKVLI